MIVSGIEIEIKKSKRKTLSIFIERDGSVSALVPDNIEESVLKEIILSKEYQIHKHLAEWKQLNERKIVREYVSGQSFLYFGRNYRLKLIEEKLGSLKFFHSKFLLSKAEVTKGREYFIDFYKKKLSSRIVPVIEEFQGKLGVQSKDVRIMELQNRWASCTASGNLNFHWKCAMVPMDVLHYIVVHELAHLLHSNHTPAFWNEVDKVIPSYDKQVQWLKDNGARLDV